jgi:tRNA(Arg) A34 adenosine deaminase TadA
MMKTSIGKSTSSENQKRDDRRPYFIHVKRLHSVMPYIKTSDYKYINAAIEEAMNSEHPQWKVGAVVVRSGRVLGRGNNRYRNNPAIVEKNDVSYHAEEVAIRRAGSTQGATIYVARITRSGYVSIAKPCETCQTLLEEAGIQTAVWTDNGGIAKARVNKLGQIARTQGRLAKSS